MDTRLADMDQASFLARRALGYRMRLQFSWIYNRPVNVDGLRRFHRGFSDGLLGVERAAGAGDVSMQRAEVRTADRKALREDLVRTLADFNLTAAIYG